MVHTVSLCLCWPRCFQGQEKQGCQGAEQALCFLTFWYSLPKEWISAYSKEEWLVVKKVKTASLLSVKPPFLGFSKWYLLGELFLHYCILIKNNVQLLDLCSRWPSSFTLTAPLVETCDKARENIMKANHRGTDGREVVPSHKHNWKGDRTHSIHFQVKHLIFHAHQCPGKLGLLLLL